MLMHLKTMLVAASDFVGPPAPSPTGLQLTDPLGAGGDLGKLLEKIGETIIDLAIPIAVILIIWIGIQFMTAQGNPEKINKAKKALFWVIIGLAIILIGNGFVSLIRSILELSNG